MIKPAVLLFLNLFILQAGIAQQFIYDNKVYQSQVKTVECYNTIKEQSLPVITLGSKEQLLFAFDDLSGGSKNYWYTVEHCSYDWKPSGISPLNYLEGTTEDRITDYAYSSKTLQKFTHYKLVLPNDQIRPKISGNYLLKVYEEGDQNKPVCSQRFYVTENLVAISTEIIPSNEVSLRFSNQKLNVTVSHTMPIQNPYNDVKLLLMQNGNPLTAKLNTKPTFVRPGSLIYNDINSNDFSGSNEFRKFDFRSFRYKGVRVQSIMTDKQNEIVLFRDQSGQAPKYTLSQDDNGAFFIRNQDNIDNDTDSDYARVFFSLDAKLPAASTGSVYVTGRFNNFRLDEESRLSYDAETKSYHTALFLKQGVYDYQYVWKDEASAKPDNTRLEGSFFETENDYQAFLYFRKPGTRWDELIGYQTNSTTLRKP